MAPRATVPHKDVRRRDGSTKNENGLLDGRHFNASCPAFLAVGDCVRISGSSVGGLRPVLGVDPRIRAQMPVIGVIRDKPTITTALVQETGELPFAGLVPGVRYFVGNDGRPTPETSLPTALPGGSVFLQLLGYAVDASLLQLVQDLRLDAIQNPAQDEGWERRTVYVTSPTIVPHTSTNVPNLNSALLDYSGMDFVESVEILVNGLSQTNGLLSTDDVDVYPGANPAAGELRFRYPLRGSIGKPDQITMILHRGLTPP